MVDAGCLAEAGCILGVSDPSMVVVAGAITEVEESLSVSAGAMQPYAIFVRRRRAR
jgi:hypothetical protein